MAQGRATSTAATRQEGYRRANDRIRQHVPMIPLAHVGSSAAFRTDVTGAVVTSGASERFTSVVPGDRSQFVYMEHQRPAGLYCPDETDDATLLVCAQVAESLYRFDLPEPTLSPALAESSGPSADR